MTEEDAKTKWCPFARVVTIHADAMMGPANRTEVCGEDHFTKPIGSFCIASACMAWRWVPAGRSPTGYGSTLGSGYCGLAGPVQ